LARKGTIAAGSDQVSGGAGPRGGAGAGGSRAELHGQVFLSGAGAAGPQLRAELARLGFQRVALVSNRSTERDGVVGRVRAEAFADATVVAEELAVRTGITVADVEQLAARWSGLDLAAIIAIGGGATIDMAKAVALLHGLGGRLESYFMGPGESYTAAVNASCPAVITIPTTLAGAEVTSSAGIRAPDGRKRLIRSPLVSPRIICLDPTALASTPRSLLASTGMCAVAHGVEAIYSPRRSPISTALALGSARRLGRGLQGLRPGLSPGAGNLGALGDGAMLGALALRLTGSGLQHVVCQVLGAMFGITHGVAHSVMLPGVMQFNLASSPGVQVDYVAALGLAAEHTDPDPPESIRRLRAMIEAPASLRQFSLSASQLSACAEATAAHPGLAGNPRQVTGAGEIMALLEEVA
jgi:alcohol dehydrogenase class IV